MEAAGTGQLFFLSAIAARLGITKGEVSHLVAKYRLETSKTFPELVTLKY